MMIALTSAKHTILYSAWFCPFAQRVWCAMNELGVHYELVEALQIDPVSEAYVKDANLLMHNPKGLVPTLVVQENDDSEKSYVVCDSMNILKQLYVSESEDTVEGRRSRIEV